ncbi:MAG: LysR family transcriptional regulator [Rhodobacteraceae bacterium]|jgi:DNA-binding transcriptional LysR family regulator|nr:LysR family transcriptional regulator [Paracoccaceae bacterium]
MTLRRRLPSANALFAFEAAARLGGFSRAARELNITQPAVSHAIASLERTIGHRLFHRAGPRLELTEVGERLSRATTRAFVSIEGVLAELDGHDSRREVVMLSISSGMATHWLMPRYDAFRRRFPETQLQFQLIAGSVGGPLFNCDLGLRVASGEAGRQIGHRFAPERVLAVASPAYLRERGDLHRPDTVHTLISLTDHWFDWPEFCAAGRIAMPTRHQRLAFSDYSVVIQAALNGQGLALAWTSVASRLLIDGLLQRAAGPVVCTDRSYHLVSSSQRPSRPVVEEVRAWLIAEMAREEEALVAMLGPEAAAEGGYSRRDG